MRKSQEAQRFPHSALLFRFCLRVLEMRQPATKIHDQEVGNILNYNPSDTSHWKRGKKSVRSIYALEALARFLDVDLEILQDLSEGAVDFDEAWFEFSESEDLKRSLKGLSSDLVKERRLRKGLFETAAKTLLQAAGIDSLPVYLPAVLQSLPFIQASAGDLSEKLARTSRIKPGQFAIRYRKGELRAHTRAALAREMARVILFSERDQFGLPEKIELLSYLELLDFSNALLVPHEQLKAELQKLPPRANLVRSLSEIFWVPKSVIRARIADAVLETADAGIFTIPHLNLKAMPSRVPLTADFSEEPEGSSAAISNRLPPPSAHSQNPGPLGTERVSR